ncbi:MAG: SDR family oxidoreductase [Verrucomicrobia bacterium]|nr:SDR family oxidoreductase [Verrucomicrobiota bacterium]
MKWTFLFFLPLCCFSGAIVVTCATGELGGAIAKNLSADHQLILTGRNTDKLKDQVFFYVDYNNPASIEAFGKGLEGEKIDGFVLIAPRPNFGSSLFQDEADWLKLFQSTFTGPLETLKKALPHFSDRGKIVILNGTTSVQLIPELGPGCVVRRMWTACLKALSHQLGPRNIHVNMISPGIVLTDHHIRRIQRLAEANGIDFDEQMALDTVNIPLRRHVDPNEVAQTVRFLLSDQSNFISGTNLLLDGGATLAY